MASLRHQFSRHHALAGQQHFELRRIERFTIAEQKNNRARFIAYQPFPKHVTTIAKRFDGFINEPRLIRIKIICIIQNARNRCCSDLCFFPYVLDRYCCDCANIYREVRKKARAVQASAVFRSLALSSFCVKANWLIGCASIYPWQVLTYP